MTWHFLEISRSGNYRYSSPLVCEQTMPKHFKIIHAELEKEELFE